MENQEKTYTQQEVDNIKAEAIKGVTAKYEKKIEFFQKKESITPLIDDYLNAKGINPKAMGAMKKLLGNDIYKLEANKETINKHLDSLNLQKEYEYMFVNQVKNEKSNNSFFIPNNSQNQSFEQDIDSKIKEGILETNGLKI